MRVLIVRLSSRGDMVHTLPAITDAARAISDLEIDWMVDQAFAEIPGWHQNVRDVIALPPRRFSNLYRPQFQSVFRRLRATRYDFVIDLQGHWKSAFASRFAKGTRCGYDKRSVNEWGAHVFYDKKYFVARKQHSIQRMRELLSRILNYSFDAKKFDYGIDRSRLPGNSVNLRGPYLALIHSTSWESKCWPERYWQELADQAIQSGFQIVLPWGTLAERERAHRIAQNRAESLVLPQLSIAEKASVLSGAAATVGLDTGLSHIAAALDVPSVTLYGATDPDLIGATGKNQTHLVSNFECIRCHRSICNYSRAKIPKPACLNEITPQLVWSSMQNVLMASSSAGGANRSK